MCRFVEEDVIISNILFHSCCPLSMSVNFIAVHLLRNEVHLIAIILKDIVGENRNNTVIRLRVLWGKNQRDGHE